MLYRREGYPGEDAFVLCTVTKILNHAVFVNLDEYDKGGLIHISEIAAGRIRNIREYVELSKKVVCKVLRVDAERGHVDLSLRRVSDIERRKKLEEIKQEQKAEKVIEQVAKELGQPLQAVYDTVTGKVFEQYAFVHQFFKDVSTGKIPTERFITEKNLAAVLQKHVADRFKPPKVSIRGVWSVRTFDPRGVELVKQSLLAARELGTRSTVELLYLGGGRYKMRIESETYKDAEQTLQQIEEKLVGAFSGNGEVQLAREEA